MFLSRDLYNHIQKNCSLRKVSDGDTVGHVKAQSPCLLRGTVNNNNNTPVSEILDTMHIDSISEICKEDDLIKQFGVVTSPRRQSSTKRLSLQTLLRMCCGITFWPYRHWAARRNFYHMWHVSSAVVFCGTSHLRRHVDACSKSSSSPSITVASYFKHTVAVRVL